MISCKNKNERYTTSSRRICALLTERGPSLSNLIYPSSIPWHPFYQMEENKDRKRELEWKSRSILPQTRD